MSKKIKARSEHVSATDDRVRKQGSPQLRKYHFKPGQSGNPTGRPRGSRSKISEAFIAALNEDFAQHGVAVIERVRTEKPAEYLKIVASLVPRDINLNPPGIEDMTDDELHESLEQVRTVVASLPKPAKRH